ncbi:MAG: hypothetical protein ACTMIR_04180, partial [Cellulomonadaceae bacterium]
MLDGVRSSAKRKLDEIDAEKVKDQAAHLAAEVSDVSSQAAVVAAQLAAQAKDAAVNAKDWSAPRLEAFKEWLAPRSERAWGESVGAAAPQVERAAKKAGPAIDIAHDKLVDDYLPKLVDSFNAAAAAASAKASDTAQGASAAITKAADKAAAAPDKVAKAAAKNATKRKGGKAKTFWIVVGTVAAAGGAYVVWRKSQPEVDPWAEPWEKV